MAKTTWNCSKIIMVNDKSLTHQNCTHEKIRKRLTSDNSCHYLKKEILFSCFLQKKKKKSLKHYKQHFFLFYFMGVKLDLTLREKHRLRVFENRVLRRIFGPKRDDVRENGEDYITKSFMLCIPHQISLGHLRQEKL
jgi:hypothetical protein